MSWGLSRATVRFGDRTALECLSIELQPSQVTVVIGGDSAGKTTALRAIVGLVPLAGGEASRPAKADVGYVPAFGGIYPDLTVAENLSFSGRAYGLAAHDLAGRSRQMLERIGLGNLQSRLGGHLSGGMQRKLALGLALLHGPALLVLDEPSTGIDPVSRAQLWRVISGEAASGTAVVASTTYVNEAQRAHRVVLIDRGRAVVTGTPDEVIASLPGAVGTFRQGMEPSGPDPSWLRGRAWRVWAPHGRLPSGAEAVEPDFNDAVIVAELGLDPTPPP